MKEDILEQLVDEYLQHQGYFTRHNIRFKPDVDHPEYISGKDSVASDIDVIGIHPILQGPERVMVVSCKSWQEGFRPESWISAIENDKTISGKKAWQKFRELANDKWGAAFIAKVKEITGADEFTYITAVTTLKGRREAWENHLPFLARLRGSKIHILTFEDILSALYPTITTTQASSTIGRVLQLMKASGWMHKDVRGRG
jgi:hypothetical protein